MLPFSPGSRFGVGLDFGYGAASRARFERETGLAAPVRATRSPTPTAGTTGGASASPTWCARVAAAARAAKPGVAVSAAVWAYADRAYLSIFQDWRGWLEARLLDFAVPMAYTTDDRLLALPRRSVDRRRRRRSRLDRPRRVALRRAIPPARASQRDATLARASGRRRPLLLRRDRRDARPARRPGRGAVSTRGVTLSLADFDYELPACAHRAGAGRRARRRAPLRARPRERRPRRTRASRDLPRLLRAGDLLVVNATRVAAGAPARREGERRTRRGADPRRRSRRRAAGARCVRCRGRLRVGLELRFGARSRRLRRRDRGARRDGEVVLAFAPEVSPYRVGEAPLPPYIRRDARGRERPGALPDGVRARAGRGRRADGGPALRRARCSRALAARGVELRRGRAPRRARAPSARCATSDLAPGRLHPERFELPAATADAIARTRARGGRVVAVGTTTTRVLESCARRTRAACAPGRGETDLFLRPGTAFRVVDALLTNFHLPRSSLLLLVAAFAGRERGCLDAYAEALRARLPLLLLRRRDADPVSDDARRLRVRDPRARRRRARGHARRRRTARSRRRPSCRSRPTAPCAASRPATLRGDRRADRARQHLSPARAPGRGGRRAARRPARLHRLARARGSPTAAASR